MAGSATNFFLAIFTDPGGVAPFVSMDTDSIDIKTQDDRKFHLCICLTSLTRAKPKEKNEICRSISTRAIKCDGVFFVLQHSFQYGFQHA